MQTRLLLIAHAATRAMRSGKFPADDPLDERGIADAFAWRARTPLPEDASVFASPAACALETACALGLAASAVPALADADYGHWHGGLLADIAAAEPDALAQWARDPDAAPHGGESFNAVLARVGAWMEGLEEGGTVIAVTHAIIVRAAMMHALDVPPASFSRIEVAPLSMVELRRSARRWRWLA